MSCKLSVIIPVFEVEKLLERCLNSVVNQTLRDIEIICVDDESSDRSLEVLKKFAQKDNRIKVITQQNQGQGAARNRALNVATGDYCGFVDSDDWIDLDYFEKLYNAAIAHNADIACCGITREYPSGRSRVKLSIAEERVSVSVREKFELAKLPQNCFVYNKIYRRSTLKTYSIAFLEKVSFEDIAFSLHAVYFLRKLVTVPGITYHYWVNYDSTTRRMNDLKRQDRISARAYFIDFAKKHHITSAEKNFIERKVVYRVCGLPLLKVYEWKTKKEYYLFSVIKIFEKLVTL